jgi:hypothetical protein
MAQHFHTCGMSIRGSLRYAFRNSWQLQGNQARCGIGSRSENCWQGNDFLSKARTLESWIYPMVSGTEKGSGPFLKRPTLMSMGDLSQRPRTILCSFRNASQYLTGSWRRSWKTLDITRKYVCRLMLPYQIQPLLPQRPVPTIHVRGQVGNIQPLYATPHLVHDLTETYVTSIRWC